MKDLSREEFEKLKEASLGQMRELYKNQKSIPFPDFVSVNAKEPEKTPKPKRNTKKPQNNGMQNILKFINMPEVIKSPDSMLILGLIFLLMSDNSDEKLILALLFIML